MLMMMLHQERLGTPFYPKLMVLFKHVQALSVFTVNRCSWKESPVSETSPRHNSFPLNSTKCFYSSCYEETVWDDNSHDIISWFLHTSLLRTFTFLHIKLQIVSWSSAESSRSASSLHKGRLFVVPNYTFAVKALQRLRERREIITNEATRMRLHKVAGTWRYDGKETRSRKDTLIL